MKGSWFRVLLTHKIPKNNSAENLLTHTQLEQPPGIVKVKFKIGMNVKIHFIMTAKVKINVGI